MLRSIISFFFFNDTATTEIYTLSLHDALPIWLDHQHDRHDDEDHRVRGLGVEHLGQALDQPERETGQDRKSTRLNSSHGYISYAVFCLKKKKQTQKCAFNDQTYSDQMQGAAVY